ncbi:sensor histidine kinase [Sphingomonas jatrophae]|uniref:histidine kinase n=1 Tax=Sphingomonas jatrophae TaxID=1166337 RepID=A0A1I6KZC8_9SPHN|nr:ATP-binding protein [Sphingomonas jatrophae]SFR96547.1 Signal transduction histidine kinase [Sphingomonas jatrophae]
MKLVWPVPLRSLSLRLTLLFALFFSLTVGLLYAIAHWIAVDRPIAAVERQIEQDEAEAAGIYVLDGQAALLKRLEQRAHLRTTRKNFHFFADASGRVLSTNLSTWPRAPVTGWRRIEADIHRDGEEDDYMALVLGRVFPDGARLMIGRDVEELDLIHETSQQAAWSVLGLTVLLGLTGGLLMSRAIGSRLDAITRTANTVLAGDLAGRVPLRGTGDDFDRLSETLNAMLARIETLFEAVRRVSDSIAHELRTPLARLRASMEQIPSAPQTERVDLLTEAIGEVDRLQATFDALLRIARIESGRHGFAPEKVDLSALLHDAVDFYTPEAEDSGLSIQTHIDDGIAVLGDRDMLFQAILNLLDNAIKFSREGGEIVIRAKADGQAQIEIADRGPGIAEAERERVFERFYRGQETSAVRGTGLGLSLVAAVAALHGGRLQLLSNEPGLLVRWALTKA